MTYVNTDRCEEVICFTFLPELCVESMHFVWVNEQKKEPRVFERSGALSRCVLKKKENGKKEEDLGFKLGSNL